MFIEIMLDANSKLEKLSDYKKLNFDEEAEVLGLVKNPTNENFNIEVVSVTAALVLIAARKRENNACKKGEEIVQDTIGLIKGTVDIEDVTSRRTKRGIPLLYTILDDDKKSLALEKLVEMNAKGRTSIEAVCNTKVNTLTALTALLVLLHTKDELSDLRKRHFKLKEELSNVEVTKKHKNKPKDSLTDKVFVKLRDFIDQKKFKRIEEDDEMRCLKFVRDSLNTEDYEELYKFIAEPKRDAPEWLTRSARTSKSAKELVVAVIRNYKKKVL